MSDHEALIGQHVARWGFRPREPFESPEQYRQAVITFLETRDWAASFEVRLGKTQNQWTPAEVKQFAEHLLSRRRPSGVQPASALFVELEDVVMPCTIDALLEISHVALDDLAKRRRADHQEELPIVVYILRLDGCVGITTCSSNNRISVLKVAIQTLPVYGYVLAFDAFVHEIKEGTAKKRDALMTHIGTRDDRRVVKRTYTVTGSRVVFDAEQVIDFKTPTTVEGEPQSFTDPYAELFVSVPPSTTTPM